jgi:hypothetical protein
MLYIVIFYNDLIFSMPSYPLHHAIRANDASAVKQLLSQPEINPNEQDEQGNTTLTLLIESSEEVIDNWFFHRQEGNQAIKRNRLILGYLLDHPHINFFSKNNRQETPFDVAVRVYCHDYYNCSDDVRSIAYKVRKKLVGYYITGLLMAMKEQSPSNEMDLSEKYYSENVEQQDITIENLIHILQIGIQDRERFITTVRVAYSEIKKIIQLVIKITQYYEKIAYRHGFFKGNNHDISYKTVWDWIRRSENDKKVLSILGHRPLIQSSALGKLPQEIIDYIRLFISGSPVLSQHSFSHLAFKEKPYEEADTDKGLSSLNK